MASNFIAFQRHTESDPWGHELIINMDPILKIEVLYFTQPDESRQRFRLSLESGRTEMTSDRWYQVYVAGEMVTVTKAHGKVYDMIADIVKNSIKAD